MRRALPRNSYIPLPGPSASAHRYRVTPESDAATGELSRGLALKAFGAHPAMTGDIERRAVRAFELDLEEAFAVALLLAHEAFGAERLQMLGGLLRIVDQDAEVMHAGVVHALADRSEERRVGKE